VQQRDLAEAFPGAKRPDKPPVLQHIGPARSQDVEVLAALALPDQRVPGLDVGVLQRRRKLLDRRDRQRPQQGDRTQSLDVGVAHAHLVVEPPEREPTRGDRQRREQADRHEGETNADQLNEEGRYEAPDRHPERQDRLEAGEHPREDGLVGQPGKQRESRDIDQRVADSDDAKEHNGRRLMGEGADDDERRPEERDASAEPERESAAPDKAKREERAEHPARSDGRDQDAHRRVACAQEVDGDHDGENGEAAARERLHEAEPRNQ
jgi:hypothetical protein